MLKKKTLLLLFGIFIIAFVLRVIYIRSLSLFFWYDQARDAFIAQEIADGDFKILGPPSSTPGLFHGVFYYYFLAPAYSLGGGNPVFAVYWLTFFNCATVFVIYLLAYLLTKSKQASLLSAFLFAVSFESTQYATWLSNPALAVFTVPVLYIGLWRWVSGDGVGKKLRFVGPIVTAIGLGLSVQSEIFLVYHLIPVALWLWIGRKNVNKKEVLIFTSIFILTLSSMIISEFKFGFKGVGGLLSLSGIEKQDSILAQRDLGDFVVLFVNQIGRTFSNVLFPLNLGYGGMLGFVFIYLLLKFQKKGSDKKGYPWELFLLTYLFSHLPVVTLGGVSTPYLMVGIGSAMVILAGVVLADLSKKYPKTALLLLFLIVSANLISIITRYNRGQIIFSIQKDMLLKNEFPAIDYTYQSSNNEPFAINTLTSPLWINTVWSFLYNGYGYGKYGYLPGWLGRDQVGQLGNNLKPPENNVKIIYFIKEPPQGILGYHLESEAALEDTRSTVLETRQFGQITVEKRILKK